VYVTAETFISSVASAMTFQCFLYARNLKNTNCVPDHCSCHGSFSHWEPASARNLESIFPPKVQPPNVLEASQNADLLHFERQKLALYLSESISVCMTGLLS